VAAHRTRRHEGVEAGVDTAAVRARAASNGIEVSARGRLPKDVVERYRAAGY
jgi:hypothetical protein